MDGEPSESFWVNIKEQTSMGVVVVCVCCRPPDQEQQVAEVLYRQIGAALCLQALVFMGELQLSICWRYSNP